MCGRFFLKSDLRIITEMIRADHQQLLFENSYNIAPTQQAAVVRNGSAGWELAKLHWGLVPSWAKDSSMGSKMINARSETIIEKPSFRDAFQYRRCLIPADGFYEWQKVGKTTQPHVIRMKSEQPFAFAGLWEKWNDLETFTIITTSANDLLKPLHERMPVILQQKDYEQWLDPSSKAHQLLPKLQPFPKERMEHYPVRKLVNSPKNNSEKCLEPMRSELLFE